MRTLVFPVSVARSSSKTTISQTPQQNCSAAEGEHSEEILRVVHIRLLSCMKKKQQLAALFWQRAPHGLTSLLNARAPPPLVFVTPDFPVLDCVSERHCRPVWRTRIQRHYASPAGYPLVVD